MAQAISQDDYLNDTSQFDLARKKAQDQSAVNLQTRKDALARRFAALGNLDSGARIKQEENTANDEASNLNNANESINAAQNAELGRRKEVVQGQQFQAGEAEKGRNFLSGESALQRAYGTSERLGSQDFTHGERLGGQDFVGQQAALQRAYGTSERLGSQDFAYLQNQGNQIFQGSQFDRQIALNTRELDTAGIQFDKAFKEEQKVNQANIDFGNAILNKKDALESILGNLPAVKISEFLSHGGGQKLERDSILGGLAAGPAGAVGGAIISATNWG